MQQQHTAIARLATLLGITPGEAALVLAAVGVVIIIVLFIACWALSHVVVPTEADPPPPLRRDRRS
jgi:hypothetical protein